MAIAAAIKLFENKNGNAPNNLQELVPGYLPEVYSDPFNDFKPLKYEKSNKGWVVYSFGPDRKDDGAQKLYKFDDKDKKDETGDIVFSSE